MDLRRAGVQLGSLGSPCSPAAAQHALWWAGRRLLEERHLNTSFPGSPEAGIGLASQLALSSENGYVGSWMDRRGMDGQPLPRGREADRVSVEVLCADVCILWVSCGSLLWEGVGRVF